MDLFPVSNPYTTKMDSSTWNRKEFPELDRVGYDEELNNLYSCTLRLNLIYHANCDTNTLLTFNENITCYGHCCKRFILALTEIKYDKIKYDKNYGNAAKDVVFSRTCNGDHDYCLRKLIDARHATHCHHGCFRIPSLGTGTAAVKRVNGKKTVLLTLLSTCGKDTGAVENDTGSLVSILLTSNELFHTTRRAAYRLRGSFQRLYEQIILQNYDSLLPNYKSIQHHPRTTKALVQFVPLITFNNYIYPDLNLEISYRRLMNHIQFNVRVPLILNVVTVSIPLSKPKDKDVNCFSYLSKTIFSIYEAYRNNWNELSRTMIFMLGPELAYVLFCVVFSAVNVLGMFTIPWMVLALRGYRYTMHFNLVGLKVRRKKDGKVVYGTMGGNRFFGVDFLRGRFGLLVLMNSLVKSQAVDNMPDGCKGKNGGYPTYDRSCYPKKAVDDWIAGGTLKENVVSTYGTIENWIMSDVTDISYLFYFKKTFTADLSKWDVSQVTTMYRSTYHF